MAKKKEILFKHEWLDHNGMVTPHHEKACAYRMTQLATEATFEWHTHAETEAGGVETMLALFGAKTKAINTASTARTKGADEIEAVKAFFAELKDGEWPENRSGGLAINEEALARAIARAKEEAGADVDAEDILRRIAEEAGYKTKAMKNSRVYELYHEENGSATDLSDL